MVVFEETHHPFLPPTENLPSPSRSPCLLRGFGKKQTLEGFEPYSSSSDLGNSSPLSGPLGLVQCLAHGEGAGEAGSSRSRSTSQRCPHPHPKGSDNWKRQCLQSTQHLISHKIPLQNVFSLAEFFLNVFWTFSLKYQDS